ncbi:MAG: SDR family NAD(P)-dependent oxidoreductase [Acidimicrobiales bacterium]|nr:SDR family NAD(P)-dependent oxidoreductase [Acidimicrobiales bacterium]
MELGKSVAFVTGGASGLGEGTARAVAAAGGQVGIIDLPSSRGAALADELGDAAEFFPADVRDAEQVEAAFDGVMDRFGRIDVTANCAGVADAARVLGRDGTMFSLETYRRVVDINLIGLFDVVRHSARVMSRNEPDADGCRGVIVNVASIAGIEGQAGQAAYGASKAGVIGMTLPLARDLSSYGIRVACICPGIFDTGMLATADAKLRDRLAHVHVFPKRLGTPADFAQLLRAIVENPMLNGEVIRLDAATRLSHG